MVASSQRFLITGASGQLGSYLLRDLRQLGAEVVAWSGSATGERFGFPLQPIDLRDADRISRAFRAAAPGIVIHAAAMASVAACYKDPEGAAAINVEGTTLLAKLTSEAKARLVHVSTDMVFDGHHAPYREKATPSPLSVYGRTKADAERAVTGLRRVATVRFSLLYGPSLTGRPSLHDAMIQAMKQGKTLNLFDDEWRTPLDLPTAARALIGIATGAFEGILHLGGPERLSRLAMGERLAEVLGYKAKFAAVSRNRGQGEPRPADLSLNSARWRSLFPKERWPLYRDAIKAML
jgi:dTDP-4-dehydrorhamnose reductase